MDAVKLTLLEALKTYPEDEIVFFDGNGAGISATYAIALIYQGHPLIDDFIKDVIATALRLVVLKARNG